MKNTLLVLAICLISAAVSAQFQRSFCIEDLIIFEEPEFLPIPIGCEVIDCCAGCPGPGLIDVEISFVSNAIDEIAIAEPGNDIQADGNNNKLIKNKGTYKFQTKASTERNLQELKIGLNHDKAKLKKILAAAEKDGGDNLFIQMQAQQFLEGRLISTIIIDIILLPCWIFGPDGGTVDKINLENNTSNDDAVILLDSRTNGGCQDDLSFITANEVAVGNNLSNSSCNSEVLVFSDDNAISFTPNNTVWTNPAGDEMIIELEDRIQATTVVWIVDPSATIRANLLARAQTELAAADGFFNINHGGIDLATNVTFNQVANTATSNTITNALFAACTAGCAITPIVSNPAINTAGAINVYYINGNIPCGRAFACRNLNLIAVDPFSQPATLAHEYGHIFSLGHVHSDGSNAGFEIDVTGDGVNDGVDFNLDGVLDFGNNNIMFGGATGRTIFTEAQCMRMSIDNNSGLNTLNFRTGATRPCAASTISNTCPWLATDFPN